ncbi:hypothetical protein HMPREF1979_00881 [Actinomyces johnsonii F0542]|uniref:Uncharacterized protein n=1 Tax=Actinomyces johnsonii F0542 TaxID=1321818 RepID=U1RZC7_9ACTO|nr:hypothetical protein HMPREF1979_00881 [Actinomyces johnsonii F0542]
MSTAPSPRAVRGDVIQSSDLNRAESRPKLSETQTYIAQTIIIPADHHRSIPVMAMVQPAACT